jgi:hypothetical protein
MTLTDVDISGFNYPELSELKAKIETRMQDMRETGVPTLRERFVEEAAALGVTLEEVVASNKGKRGRPRKARDAGEEAEAAL